MPTIFVLILKMVDFEPLLTSEIPCSPRLRFTEILKKALFSRKRWKVQLLFITPKYFDTFCSHYSKSVEIFGCDK